MSVLSKYFAFNQKTDVYPITTNPEIGLPLLFISGNDIKIFYLDDKGKFNTEISVKKPAKYSALYLGSYIVDSNLVLTFSDKTLHALSQLTVNLSTRLPNEIVIESSSDDQKYLASWEKNDSLFVLGIFENSNTLVVTKFFGNGNTSKHEYEINVEKMISLNSSETLFDLFDETVGKIQKIDSSIPSSLYLTSAKNKVYLIDNEIIITIDYFDDATYYLSVNLHNQLCSTTKYVYSIQEMEQDVSTNSNSFIFDSAIFQLSVNKNEIGLKVQSLADANKVCYYYATGNQTIEFRNTSMKMRNEKEGFLFGDPVVREIKNTKKLLKMMLNMNPAISVFRKQSDFQILLGGVKDIYQTAGVSSKHLIASGGKMIVGPGGNLLMPDPSYIFPSNYSYSSYPSQKSASFSTIVSASTYIHNDKSISKYTYDFIIEYANYMPGLHGLVTIFKMKGDYYLGYYSHGEHTYNLEWFKNVDDYSIQY